MSYATLIFAGRNFICKTASFPLNVHRIFFEKSHQVGLCNKSVLSIHLKLLGGILSVKMDSLFHFHPLTLPQSCLS